MFRFSGSYTTFTDGQSITVSDKIKPNQWKGFSVTLSTAGTYTITSNTETQIFFSGNVTSAGDYTVSLLTPTELLNEDLCVKGYNIDTTDALHHIKKAELHFRALLKAKYNDVHDDSEQPTLHSLSELKPVMLSYALSSLCGSVSQNDSMDSSMTYKSQHYEHRYNKDIDMFMSLVRLDVNEDGKIDEAENVRQPNVITIL